MVLRAPSWIPVAAQGPIDSFVWKVLYLEHFADRGQSTPTLWAVRFAWVAKLVDAKDLFVRAPSPGLGSPEILHRRQVCRASRVTVRPRRSTSSSSARTAATSPPSSPKLWLATGSPDRVPPASPSPSAASPPRDGSPRKSACRPRQRPSPPGRWSRPALHLPRQRIRARVCQDPVDGRVRLGVEPSAHQLSSGIPGERQGACRHPESLP